MRKYGNAILYFFFCLLIPVTMPAEQLDITNAASELFPRLEAAGIEELMHEKEYTRYFYEGESPSLLPAISGPVRDTLLREMDAISPTIGVESIFILPLPDLIVSSGKETADESLLVIYNTLRSLSSLQGIEYYSASRKRMRTLFKEAYVIGHPDSRDPLPDPLVDTIPAESDLYIFQHDLTFGKNVSHGIYRSTGTDIVLSLTNLTVMRYALLPFVREQNMQTHLIVIPRDGFIFFYGYIGVETFNLRSIAEKKKESFYNRLKALYTWFSTTLPVLTNF